MRMFLHLLRYKFIAFLKSTFELRTLSIVRSIGSAVVFGAFAVGAYILARNLTQFVVEQTRVGLFLYHQFISMMLFVFFVAVNLGNIIVSYATIYRSTEVSFLMTKPVPHLTVFVLKFLDNFLYSSTTLFLMAFMTLLGYGAYFGHSWLFYAGVMVGIVIPFMFLSACLAVLILMGIMRLAGRFGFRQVMAGIFALYFFFIYVFFRISNPIRLVETVNRYYPNIDEYVSRISPGILQFLPNHWVAQFLYWSARNDWAHALPYGLLVPVMTAGMFVIVLVVAKHFYYRSWLVSLQVQSSAMAPYHPHRIHLIDFRRGGWLPPQFGAFLKKETFSFLREPSQWIHLVVMIVLAGLFILSVRNLNLRLRVVDVQLLTYLVLLSFGGFLTGSLALRFVFPMTGLEGKAFWSVRTSPVELWKIYAFRFVAGFALVLTIAVLVAVAMNTPFVRMSARRPLLLWFGLYDAFWTALAVVAINLGFGTYFANYQEKNPIRAASSQGATLTFLFVLLFLFLKVVIILYPLARYFSSLFHFTPFNMRLIVAPGTLLAVLSMLVAAFASGLGLRALRRDF